MKTAAKVLVGFVVIAALVVVGGRWFLENHASEVAQSTVAQATGSEELGELTGKVMDGEDLTDSEIQSALGVDSATYQKIKEAAAQAGVDLNDSSQLREIALENADKADEVQSIASAVQSGSMSEAEAAQAIKALVGQ